MWRATTESARRRIAEEERKKLEAAEKRERTKQANWAKKHPGESPVPRKRAKKTSPEVTGAKRIRVFPRTAEQLRLLRLAFDTTRYVYNACAAEMNAGRSTKAKYLRSVAVNNAATERPGSEAEWKEVPYEVRDGAMLDAKKARASTLARIESQAEKKGGKEATQKALHAWEFKYRKKRGITESFAVRARDLNRGKPNRFYATLFGTAEHREVMDAAEPLPRLYSNDVRLWHHKVLDAYYLIVPMAAAARPENQGPAAKPAAPARRDRKVPKTESETEARRLYKRRKVAWREGCKARNAARAATRPAIDKVGSVVSVDMGMRTFATCYDPVREIVTKWGSGATSRLWRMANEIQSLRKRAAEATRRRRGHMRVAEHRVERRIRCFVDEMHRKLALWLCRNHDTVIVGELHVKACAKKLDTRGAWRRRIPKQAVRKLYSLAHYRFRQFLLHKGRQFGTCVVIADEAWTTKTCCVCGKLNHFVGASEVFRCAHCDLVIDRDVNAARNIWLKFVHDEAVRGSDDADAPLQQQQPVRDSGGRAGRLAGGLRQCQLQAFFSVL